MLLLQFIIKLFATLLVIPLINSQNATNFIVAQNSFQKELPINSQKPIIIQTSYIIEDVSTINLNNEEYRVDYSIENMWSIHANYCLNWVERYSQIDINFDKEIFITGSDLDNIIWVPDLAPDTAKRVEIITNPIVRLNITNNICTLRLVKRQAVIMGCNLNFVSFPYDAQVCDFVMRSHSYSVNEVQFVWTSFRSVLEPNKHIRANYKLSYSSSSLNLTFNGVSYSSLMVTYKFVRHLSTFGVQVIYPTVLIVFVAYCSFWIAVDSGPGRFLLCILTFLALFTSFTGIKGQLPPVSYVIAVDIWYMVCMLFVFVSIVELSAVFYLNKLNQLKSAKMKEEEQEYRKSIDNNNNIINAVNNNSSINTIMDGLPRPKLYQNYDHYLFVPQSSILWQPNETNQIRHNNGRNLISKRQVNIALKVDIYFRIYYPLCFLLFNLIFWPLLLTRNIL